MDKTISISLGGFSFTIDEVAYRKLKAYLDAIRRSLNNMEGTDEIMSDVEIRIAELFKERMGTREVVNEWDVDHIVSVMGSPEQYIDEGADTEEDFGFTAGSSTAKKKLFRDPDDKVLAGVLSGLAHYLGIESWITRVGWLVLFFADIPFTGASFTILAYIIFWIILPKAVTTEQKYQMHGQPANFENIKKNVSQFANDNSATISSASSTFSDILKVLVKLVLAFFGIILILIGIGFVISAILILVLSAIKIPFLIFDNSFDYPWQDWLAKSLIFLTVIIPALFSILLGAKLISRRVKVNRILAGSALGLWVIAIIGSSVLSFSIMKNFNNEIEFADKKAYTVVQDTLVVAFDDYQFKSKKNLSFGIGNSSNEFVEFNNETHRVIPKEIEIFQSTDDQVWVEVVYFAKGSSLDDARKSAEQINYNYALNTKGELNLNQFLSLGDKAKIRNQSVSVNLYIPKEKTLFLENTKRAYFYETGSNYRNYKDGNNKFYKFVEGKVNCLNCKDLDSEDEKSEDKSAKVKISRDGIDIQDGKDKVIINTKQIKITDGTDSINIDVTGN